MSNVFVGSMVGSYDFWKPDFYPKNVEFKRFSSLLL